MSADGYSIRGRLFRRLLPAFAALALVLFYYLDAHARRAAERSFDNLLAAAALSIADAVQQEDGAVTLELPYSSHAILANHTSSRIFYRVSAPDGALVTGYETLAASIRAADSAAPRFSYETFLGVPVRVCALGRFVSGRAINGWVTIVVAQTNEEQERLTAELLQYSLGPALAMMVLAAVLIWLAVGSALRPLNDIERAILANDPASLKALDLPVPRETRHLVAALNALIARLTALLSRMQGFLAESAHQIRTPLSNMRAQIDVAIDDQDPAAVQRHLKSLQRSITAASRLANQLLTDTMITHRGEIIQLAPTDLLELVELVTEEFADQTGARLRLAIDTLTAAPYISGDSLMLSEAIKNLLDNALKFGAGTEILVRLEAQNGRANLSIADRGPGIAAPERARITERFVRGSRAGETPGSGLGLAIVASVVERHGGGLSFADRDGGGLVVQLTFPLIDPPGEATA